MKLIEKIVENNMEIIGALSENYLNVFQVNPIDKTVKIVKLDGYVTVGFDKSKDVSYDYDTMVKRYLDGRVCVEDRTYLDNAMSLSKVISELKSKKSYVGKYRVLEGGKVHYYQYKYTTTNKENIIIAGFSNIDDIIEKEMEYNAELEKKNAELESVNSERDRQIEILRAISDIYYSMHYIDLISNTTVEYSADVKLKPYVHGEADAYGQITLAMKHRCSREHMDQILVFTNLNNLSERLKNKKVITTVFLNVDNIWMRASFIKVDSDSENRAQSVIFTTQIVDEEKRREESLIIHSYTDSLTKLFNRRAFERTVEKYNAEGIPENLYIVSFDLNGLKQVNDTMGHAVGDELIIGATVCINSSFGSYGTLYRVGGDEFVGVISAKEKEMNEIVKDFEQVISKWHSDRIDSLSIAFDYVSARENKGKSFEELVDLADLKMYEAKRKHYLC